MSLQKLRAAMGAAVIIAGKFCKALYFEQRQHSLFVRYARESERQAIKDGLRDPKFIQEAGELLRQGHERYEAGDDDGCRASWDKIDKLVERTRAKASPAGGKEE